MTPPPGPARRPGGGLRRPGRALCHQHELSTGRVGPISLMTSPRVVRRTPRGAWSAPGTEMRRPGPKASARSSGVAQELVGRLAEIMVRRSPFSSSRWVRRFFLFMARKPSKVNRPVGRPDTARAVTRRAGAGDGHHIHPTLGAEGHQLLAGVGHRRSARVGDQGAALPGQQAAEHRLAPRPGVVAVIGEHGLFQPQVVEQLEGHPGILRGNKIHLPQGIRDASGDVPQVADGGGYQNTAFRPCILPPV